MSKKRKQKKKVQKGASAKQTLEQPRIFIPPQQPAEFPVFVESENGDRQIGFLK